MAWFRANARDLPWRRTKDPYAIWVSEIMLQQTRVETVWPYYEKFVARWPSVRSLASADPEEVRAAWSGLGYYRRAELMLEAAKMVAARPDGRLPSGPEELASLPGFGPYTTGAVASIAFDHPIPAIDGNAERVLSRILAVEGDVGRGKAPGELRSFAGALAQGDSPGDLNQALIELGARICVRRPKCLLCPIRDDCQAKKLGLESTIPRPRRRPKKKEIQLTAAVLFDRASIVLVQQSERDLFPRFWCPPTVNGRTSPTGAAAQLLTDYGLRVDGLTSTGEVTHVLTHRAITASVLKGPIPLDLPNGVRQVEIAQLGLLGLPTFAVKLLQRALPAQLLAEPFPGRRPRG